MLKRITAVLTALWLALSPVAAFATDNGCMLGVCRTPAAGGGGVTLNPSDIDPNGHISLSGGNLIATADGSGTYGSVRSTTSHSTGKFCFQFTSTTATWQIGIINGSDSLAGDAGSKASAYVWYAPNNGTVYHNGIDTGIMVNSGGGGFLSGQTGRVCADFDAHKAWYFYSVTGEWNGGAGADPATNTGGLTIDVGTYFAVFSGGTSDTATFNFATPTLPSGFSAW